MWAIFGDIRGCGQVDDAILAGRADIVRFAKSEIEELYEAMRTSAPLPGMLLKRSALPFAGAASCIDDVQELAFWINTCIGRCNESLLNASRLLSDKESLYRLLEAQGIQIPPRILARNLEDLERVLEQMDRPIRGQIIKPVVGTESRGVYRPRADDTASDVVSFLSKLPDLDPSEPLLVMPYISARGVTREVCLDGIVSDRIAAFCAIHEKTRVFEGYPIHDRTMVTPPLNEIDRILVDTFLSRFANAFPLSNFVFHLEARLDDHGQLIPIDLSLRPGGGLIFRSVIESCGIDLRLAHIYCCLGLDQELQRLARQGRRTGMHSAIAAVFAKEKSPDMMRSQLGHLMGEADETGGLITFDLSNVSILSAASQSIKPNVGLCVTSTISSTAALARLDRIVQRAALSWNSEHDNAALSRTATHEDVRPTGGPQQTLVPSKQSSRMEEGSSVHARFSSQARQRPDAVAIVQGGTRLSYRDLDNRSSSLAHCLMALGVRPETRVGIHLDRSSDFVIAVLATLKAGGCYVPLDVALPSARLDRMAQDSDLRILIVGARARRQFAGHDCVVICIDDLNLPAPVEELTRSPDVKVLPENLAYILYTSGSTGHPKGVAVTHQSILNLVVGQSYIDFNKADCILQAAPLSFDASTFELWGALLHGRKCVLIDEAMPTVNGLRRLIESEKVDTAWFTASLFNTIVDDAPDLIAKLQQLVTGGEVVSPRHIRRAKELSPQTVIVNGYGPTETTTFACCHVCDDPGEQRNVPLGHPINNVEALVLDEELRPVAPGHEGELFIGGAGLARGYINLPELTAERFVPHPRARIPGERLYRTGDRARIRPDGKIEFLGRRDRQIKLRGFRIELDEVEHAILCLSGVREAVSSVVGEGEHKVLVAHVVIVPEGQRKVDSTSIRLELAALLPEYMIPTRIEFVDKLRRTSSGKLDRLQFVENAPSRSEKSVLEACSTVETRLIAIWEEVLGLSDVKADDDFFNRGGHSLSATRVLTRIRSQLGVDVGLRTLFELGSLRELAARVEALRSNQRVGKNPESVAKPTPSILGRGQRERQRTMLASKLSKLSDAEISRILMEKRQDRTQ
ncbi:amino acid adenylation domain-containing protein [Bradyrhizobium sp. SZCCHNR3015]|uniref:amino acid adenylation domain-containing protein n=1 Tax=Bradyrhizobium sp. SZCCHNR3015 TaxID=3057395 RepID=UPI0029168175|nr:amino acid adenylation domain-containing protein [Bradyrhizobium sp. SZCCHNR3015]